MYLIELINFQTNFLKLSQSIKTDELHLHNEFGNAIENMFLSINVISAKVEVDKTGRAKGIAYLGLI